MNLITFVKRDIQKKLDGGIRLRDVSRDTGIDVSMLSKFMNSDYQAGSNMLNKIFTYLYGNDPYSEFVFVNLNNVDEIIQLLKCRKKEWSERKIEELQKQIILIKQELKEEES